MALYHVNPETGNAGICKAEKGRCRFGESDEHYTSEEAARASYEAKQQAFRDAHRDDLAFYSPNWSGKIPKRLEKQLARAAAALEAEAKDLEAKVGKGPLSALDPMVYPIRPRGYELVKAEDAPLSYDGDSKYLLAFTSRQGGGNRYCDCDGYDYHEDGCLAQSNEILEDHPQFLFYEDDDTYTTHYYSTDFTPFDVAEMNLSASYSSEAAALRGRLLLLKSGEAPPWSILSDNQEPFSRYRGLKNSKSYRDKELRESSAELAKFKELHGLLKEERPLTDEELEKFAPLVKSSYYDRGSTFRDAHKRLLEHKQSLAKAQARHEQAEQLPEGELREYLLGDRGVGSYTTEEKVGRRKTKVTKTYKRGTLLGKELEDAKRYYASAEDSLERALKPAREKEEAAKATHEKAQEFLRQFAEARAAAWANGWPSAYGELPEPPESF